MLKNREVTIPCAGCAAAVGCFWNFHPAIGVAAFTFFFLAAACFIEEAIRESKEPK